jgi:hypothetical protein
MYCMIYLLKKKKKGLHQWMLRTNNADRCTVCRRQLGVDVESDVNQQFTIIKSTLVSLFCNVLMSCHINKLLLKGKTI